MKGRDILGGLPNRSKAATREYRDRWQDVFGDARPEVVDCQCSSCQARRVGAAEDDAVCDHVMASIQGMFP